MKLIEQIFAILEFVKIFEKIEGRTRFQKLVFLLDQKKHLSFDFEKSNYGPFSSRLYEIIDTLKKDGIIEENLVDSGEHTKYVYNLTKKGAEVLENIRNLVESSDTIEKEIINLEKFNVLSLPELVKYVYEAYPEFAGNFFNIK